MMKKPKRDKIGPIISLNKGLVTDLSIEELEKRIEIEELETRGAMWTGCNCDCHNDLCVIDW